MVNETTSKSANFGSKSRKERVDLARSRDILDVAEQLGMELERAGRDYRWKEHDSLVITPNKNVWKWFSRDQGGDVIALVETIKEINFNQAIDYLNDGVFKTFDSSGKQEKQEPFRYLMEKYEHPDFEIARNYLKNERGLSDETINFFLTSGKMAEATRKKGDYFEPVIVFKYKDLDGKLVGASLQGIVENRVQHPERGRLKQIIQNSDGMQGFSVDVGNPKRLVFAESSIDLMSYYQANKDHLNDARLVAMDGLKESTVGFHLAQLQSELSGRPLNWSREQLADGVNIAAQNGFFKDGKRSDMITLAVDNDTAGHNFITNFLKKEIPIQIDIPPILYRNRDKADWNDYLTRPTTSGTVLYHVYSFDRENEDYHYHGYYPEELAVFKQKELTSDKVKVVTSKEILAKEEIEPLIAFTEGVLQDSASQKALASIPELQVRSYANQISYGSLTGNIKTLTESVQNKIQRGQLSIHLSDEVYFYTLVNYTGWSYPMQQLKPAALDVLKEHRSFFESINETNIERFKEKGTPEQNQMYQLLKGIQKELGRSDTSTIFSEEVAISAYNLNKRLDSLTAENWGKSISEPLNSLGRDTWNILSYPANQIDTPNNDYFYQLVPYHLLEYLEHSTGQTEISVDVYEQILDKLKDRSVEVIPPEKNIAEVGQMGLFSDTQKEHIREFFKTRISDVKTDYIYLPNGQEDIAYYLDGYLFAHHYAELDMLSPEKQVDAIMSRLVSEDGQKVDHVALGFDIERIDRKLLEDTFGYNSDTPIEEYRHSEKNIDRIAEKEEQVFRAGFDRQSFADTIGLMQKYSIEEVLNPSDNIYHDEIRHRSLLKDLSKVNTDPMYHFIARYMDEQGIKLSHTFDTDNQIVSYVKGADQFSIQNFITTAQEKDLLNEEPSVAPWKAITVTQPVNSYTVFTDKLSKEFDNVSDLYQFVNKKLKRSQRRELSALLSQPGRGTPLDTLMAIDSAAGGNFNVEVNGQSILSLFPNGINEEATEIYFRSSAEIEDSLQNITQEKDQKDNSRLAQAQRKLNRLKGELDNSIQAAQEHQNLTNGQPMNDKRNGAAFFKKQEQLENKVFSTMDEIKKQEERVEKLQYQKELKEKGLNRQGNGLEMSVQNLPKIREEIEKADRGESMFTKETIKRYRQELERLEAAQNKTEGVTIQPAAQSLIDEGLVNQWQKRPDTYFVKGLRRVALELTEEGTFQISSNWKYQPKTEDEKEKVEDLLNRQSLQQEHIIKDHVEVKPQLQVAFDFSENQVLSNKYHEGDIVLYQEFVKDFYPEMIRRRTESVALQNGYDKTYFALLDENNNELVKDIRFDLGDPTTRLSEKCENYLPPKYLTIAKEIDQNYFGDQSSIQEVTENIKKAPEQAQEQMIDRTNGGTGSLQPEAEGSTSPVLETSTFERSVTSRPTSSYPYLHFTTNYAEVQKRIGNYHPITPVDLKRLNQYAPSIQSTARWYLDELADSKISFIYADRGIENILEVTFQKENFIHLSGIRPFEEGKGAADFLEDFASGYGSYDGVLISNAIKDKLQVLPMLQDILEPQSFVLDDLTSVEKLHNLNMSEAIKSKDEDFLLLFKDTGNEKIPASLMKLKGELATNVQELTEKTILGIYRERNGQIEQLAINDDYVKDDGKEMLSVLKNRQYEEILERIEPQNEQLSQLENQSLNQELGKDLDRPLNVLESVSEDAEMGQEASSISPKQELKDGLARRVEEITKQNQKEALVASIPELQEKLSRESDLIGSSLTDEGMLYTHQESFGKDYQLELAVHSSIAVESLTEQPAPWSLAVLKDNQILGYLAYGSDWGNDFQIEDNLEGLVEQILSEEVSKGLYSQEEIDTFLKEIQVGEDRQNNQVEEFSSDASFDYEKASAYELSEIAFQKIREFTQSPEELAHYMDFMSKFPTLSPRNAALVQAQWPGANAVATFNQWKALGETLGISSDDVVQTTNTFTNKRTGNSQEVTKQTLSVKAGEHAQITLFRPVMEEMIPVFDENGKQVINGKGHPKFKKKKEASLEEKQLIAEGKLKVVRFQVRDLLKGQGKFTLYKVFELSQTNLKPEAYPKAMPNRHYNFETDKVKTKEVLLGLQDYAQKLGVAISTDEHHVLGNAKGAFYPNDQKILLNPDNSIGEKIGTTIHELAHATLHNFHEEKNELHLSTGRKELEAEMTSYLVSKHFGLDTSEEAIQYMSHWTNQLKDLNDKELNQSMTRIHKTVSCVIKSVEKHTKPYQLNKNRGQNFGSRFPNKSLKM
ncbi:PBECR4 domain-containing protein [Streptococcus constellatus subsp. viborgensis]|nr:PBECR4 domain-containing protein [Streptococcus constellatus]